ncbi:MAG: hypothetical protein QW522_04455 [Candidatus Methanomethyliaceae archaeon]
MDKIRLSIPFSIPILGEAFIDTNNPALFSTISFLIEAEISFYNSNKIVIPIIDKSIKKIMENYFSKKNLYFEFNINPPNNDFISLTSILYLIGDKISEYDIVELMSKLNGASLIKLMRALTALSGGFVIFRKNEGIISINGKLDSTIFINLKNKNKSQNRIIKKFANEFPELYQPMLHTIGHITIEGGKAVRDGDSKKLGRLMLIESGISLTMGLVKPKDLMSVSKIKNIYGGKVILAGDVLGEIILTSNSFLQYNKYQKYHFVKYGVREIA